MGHSQVLVRLIKHVAETQILDQTSQRSVPDVRYAAVQVMFELNASRLLDTQIGGKVGQILLPLMALVSRLPELPKRSPLMTRRHSRDLPPIRLASY
ncbi:hypothetical protein LINPERPRIM_LOCUS37549 [Linum perenne]